MVWYLGVYLAIGVPFIGVHLTGYVSYRQPSYRRVSFISYLIGVSLVDVISVIRVDVSLIGVHLIGVIGVISVYRVDGYLIGVHLIGAIGVVSVHLIGVCLRHQVWRSVSILVSVWMEYRHFSAIL